MSEAEIWDTEVGAEHDSGASSSTPDVAQEHRFEHLIEISEQAHVKRLYYFNFQGTGVDRGLIEPGETVNTSTRPIWTTIKCRPAMPAC
jgi:hypothetical protein